MVAVNDIRCTCPVEAIPSTNMRASIAATCQVPSWCCKPGYSEHCPRVVASTKGFPRCCSQRILTMTASRSAYRLASSATRSDCAEASASSCRWNSAAAASQASSLALLRRCKLLCASSRRDGRCSLLGSRLARALDPLRSSIPYPRTSPISTSYNSIRSVQSAYARPNDIHQYI